MTNRIETFAGMFGKLTRWGGRLEKDISPTLTTSGGDNLMSVVIKETKNTKEAVGCDMYNQTLTGGVQ